LSEFDRPDNQAKLSSDGLSVIAKLKGQMDSLSGFDAVPMITRPDYGETLTAAEDALNKSEQFKAEMAQ
jgi:hypothetical protein